MVTDPLEVPHVGSTNVVAVPDGPPVFATITDFVTQLFEHLSPWDVHR